MLHSGEGAARSAANISFAPHSASRYPQLAPNSAGGGRARLDMSADKALQRAGIGCLHVFRRNFAGFLVLHARDRRLQDRARCRQAPPAWHYSCWYACHQCRFHQLPPANSGWTPPSIALRIRCARCHALLNRGSKNRNGCAGRVAQAGGCDGEHGKRAARCRPDPCEPEEVCVHQQGDTNG